MRRNTASPLVLTVFALAMSLLPATSAGAADPWLDEDFEGGASGTFGASGISETSDGHQGDGIRVDIPRGEHWGTTTHWNTRPNVGFEPHDMWLRYWIKFPEGFRIDEPYRGKLPGFGGLYSGNCRGNRASTTGSPCWSARMAFSPLYPGDGLPSYPVDASKVTRVSWYAYLLNSNGTGQTGRILHWDPDKSTLRHGRWYCVEARVRVNDLGQQNGILEGYVDGSQAFRAGNLNFRRPSESHLKVRSLWFDVYYGGSATSPQRNQIFFDSVAAGPDRIGCNDSSGRSSGTFFDDDDSIFEDSIEKLARSGITKGCNPPTNDRFCPEDPVTRGQMAAFLRRALEDRYQIDLPAPPGSPPDYWGAATDIEYTQALDIYSNGGAPLDTYVITHHIDETDGNRDWLHPGGVGDPKIWVPVQLDNIWDRGATPYIRVLVEDLDGLADGNFDRRIDAMMRTFGTFVDQGGGRRVLIDILPEANNVNFPYGDDPTRFKAAFQKVARKARTELGNRVRIVFSALEHMNSDRFSKTTWGLGGYRLYWPGNSFVDVAGVNGYDDRGGSNVGFYQAPINEMVSVAGPGVPMIVAVGGAPSEPNESAQMDYVRALANFSVDHQQMLGIQWDDRRRGGDDMRVRSGNRLQAGFAAASSPARNGGVDWLFSPAAGTWSKNRRAAIPFDDSTGSIFVDAIRWLAKTGITKGCGPRSFCPDDNVTRGEMAAFLVRALDLPAPRRHISFDDSRNHTFEDDISRLAHARITVGCNPPANDRFCPNENVTREQMAAFLVRAGLTD